MNTPTPDPYLVLGVPKEATPAEITHAFRELVRRYHPDTRKIPGEADAAGSDDTLRLILDAYALLHDPGRPQPSEIAPKSRPTTPAHGSNPGQPAITIGPVRWH